MISQKESKNAPQIEDFIRRRGWLTEIRCIRFLAAGEYNENYLVESGSDTYVFRINHGSQLGLNEQIRYEYGVLGHLSGSGVTPRPFFCSTDKDTPGNGVLLMEYLPGRPLEYRRDIDKAARVFATVHAQPTGDDLIIQDAPVKDIAAESFGLINRYKDHPMQGAKSRLLAYHDEILDLADSTKNLYTDERMCIVNTEVNSQNFIIGSDGAYLVDWEKAVVSCRYQDLGHFLVPTTTLWKSDYSFDDESRREFLKVYASYMDRSLSIDELSRKTEVMERTILLRALSWCYMAYYEYTCQERSIKNMSTFQKIKLYLKEMECFLK